MEEKSYQLDLEQWQDTFEAISEPVVILDTEFTVLKANYAAYELLATGSEDIIGMKCFQLFGGQPTDCPGCAMQPQSQHRNYQAVELENKKLGKILRVSCVAIFREGVLNGYVYSIQDITRQRNLEKQLVQAQKMEAIATLAGGIAHDFNNILGAILGNADLLLYRLPERLEDLVAGADGQLTVQDIREHLGAIQKAGLRARDLVSQILAFSRQTDDKRREISIVPIIKEATKLLQASLPATIELRTNINGNIGMILADPTQIHQIVMNLCTNSVAAVHENGRHGVIDISLQQVVVNSKQDSPCPELKKGTFIALSVKDNGCGMSDDILERIFEPFFTTREVGSGTGMGLAVLHGIVTAHNGVIDVWSEPGKGTAVTIYFPRITGNDEDAAIASLAQFPLGSETIIFADDEKDDVKMRTRMLEYLGYTVLPAFNGAEVLSYLETRLEEIDLVITDQTMPKMTGLELAEKIHAMRSDLPIILCSGYTDDVTGDHPGQLGICKFLAKPIEMRDLAVAIRQIFDGNT